MGYILRSRPFSVTKFPPPFADQGKKLGHSSHGVIQYSTPGWATNTKQVSNDTFRVAFDREGVNGRTAHILVGALHPGDAEYRMTVAVASFDVPYANTGGTVQTLTFDPIPDQPAGASSLTLNATSSAGVAVDFYVSWGPADIVEGNVLAFTQLPVRAKYPIEVSVTAYQWGRGTSPILNTATPITRTFNIVKA
eukprot:NODE_717_length_1233_cov_215.880912_g448_i2.p1 GENE.NODE_717_length_1233_cov_215.880912_g448_i2~~NODE_717_length_1233_cov_215.880912_g448_i2.p1  ORF type:complete len:194 (+),score=31.02 NODE_717_length_1233_cov_215.880912_g448_i2:470-1051(+)